MRTKTWRPDLWQNTYNITKYTEHCPWPTGVGGISDTHTNPSLAISVAPSFSMAAIPTWHTCTSNASTLAASATPTKAKKEQSLRAENVLSQRTDSVGNWRTEIILLQANSVSPNFFQALRIHHWENCWASSVTSSGICQKRKKHLEPELTSPRRLTSTRICAVHWKQILLLYCTVYPGRTQKYVTLKIAAQNLHAIKGHRGNFILFQYDGSEIGQRPNAFVGKFLLMRSL